MYILALHVAPPHSDSLPISHSLSLSLSLSFFFFFMLFSFFLIFIPISGEEGAHQNGLLAAPLKTFQFCLTDKKLVGCL